MFLCSSVKLESNDSICFQAFESGKHSTLIPSFFWLACHLLSSANLLHRYMRFSRGISGKWRRILHGHHRVRAHLHTPVAFQPTRLHYGRLLLPPTVGRQPPSGSFFLWIWWLPSITVKPFQTMLIAFWKKKFFQFLPSIHYYFYFYFLSLLLLSDSNSILC